MRHVMGQNQKAFRQRGNQNHNDGKRNISNQIAEPPANRHQTEKGNDRGQRRRKDRGEHALCGIFCGDNGAFAQNPRAEICVFSHNNGIIDHNPEGNNQSEERNHIDRQP